MPLWHQSLLWLHWEHTALVRGARTYEANGTTYSGITSPSSPKTQVKSWGEKKSHRKAACWREGHSGVFSKVGKVERRNYWLKMIWWIQVVRFVVLTLFKVPQLLSSLPLYLMSPYYTHLLSKEGWRKPLGGRMERSYIPIAMGSLLRKWTHIQHFCKNFPFWFSPSPSHVCFSKWEILLRDSEEALPASSSSTWTQQWTPGESQVPCYLGNLSCPLNMPKTQLLVLLSDFVSYKAPPYTLFHWNHLELGVVGHPGWRWDPEPLMCLAWGHTPTESGSGAPTASLESRALLCPLCLAPCFSRLVYLIPHTWALKMWFCPNICKRIGNPGCSTFRMKNTLFFF